MDLENINLVPLTNIKQELLDAGGGGDIVGGSSSSSGVVDTACIGNSDNVCLTAGTSSADTATTVCDSVEKQVISFLKMEYIQNIFILRFGICQKSVNLGPINQMCFIDFINRFETTCPKNISQMFAMHKPNSNSYIFIII